MSGEDYSLTDTVLENVDYVTSDFHLNHRNIIEHCRSDEFEANQPGLDNMNWRLLANWNRTVHPSDTVAFVGDFAWFMDQTEDNQGKVDDLWDILNGKKVFVKGDHDYLQPSSVDEWYYSAVIRHADHSYFVSHFPGDTPEHLPGDGMPGELVQNLPYDFADRFDGWRIHGHHHNNWPDEYPLANPDRKTINCSVELTDYRPLSLDKVDRIVSSGERVHSISEISIT